MITQDNTFNIYLDAAAVGQMPARKSKNMVSDKQFNGNYTLW
jgi:hypothetical protein